MVKCLTTKPNKPRKKDFPMTYDNKNHKENLDLNSFFQEYILSLLKQTMETLMKEELTNVLNYEKYSSEGRGTGNSRNGYYSRNYETKYGIIEDIKIPRDRNNEFEQQLIPAYARRDDWLETMIIRMYASGVSTREIAGIIEKLYGNSYSAATVSNITDVALEEIEQWHNRTLKKRYSVIYIDALHIKLRRDTVSSDAVYFILGVDEDGYREVLDFFIGVNESAYVWEDNLRLLKGRGVEEVLLFVMDGLSGLDDAVHRVYPKADIQRCMVHKVRNAIRSIRKKDINEFTTDLKVIYESPSYDQCKVALDDFSTKWSKSYKRLVESWLKDEDLFTYYKYPVSIRKSIYTTNWIERFNKEVRRLIKTKDSLPTEDACSKLVYYKVISYNESWSSKKLRGFSSSYDALQDMFAERYS